MSEPQPIVTQPHNPFLLETFRAFVAEGLPVPVASTMTAAHIQHGAAKANIDQATALAQINAKLARFGALDKIATQLERIADVLTDPVELGRILALVRAADAKRVENAAGRESAAATESFDELLRERE